MKTCIHYSTKNLLASCKVCLCFLLLHCMVWLFYFHGDQIFMDFIRFLIHDNLWSLYTWCLRYNICSSWFLDIRISTCFLKCWNPLALFGLSWIMWNCKVIHKLLYTFANFITLITYILSLVSLCGYEIMKYWMSHQLDPGF